ncbi:hypothetical protein ACC736_38835, partial [Rhizobium ruizarguesonis]
KWFLPLFGLVLVCGLGYVAYSLARDLTTAVAVPWILLCLARRIGKGVIDFRAEPLYLSLTAGPQTFETPLKAETKEDLNGVID